MVLLGELRLAWADPPVHHSPPTVRNGSQADAVGSDSVGGTWNPEPSEAVKTTSTSRCVMFMQDDEFSAKNLEPERGNMSVHVFQVPWN